MPLDKGKLKVFADILSGKATERHGTVDAVSSQSVIAVYVADSLADRPKSRNRFAFFVKALSLRIDTDAAERGMDTEVEAGGPEGFAL